jgi:hypothetical protein
MKTDAIRPATEVLWLSTVNDGKQLILNTVFGARSHDLVRVFADGSDESLWVEIYVQDKAVQFPISQLVDIAKLASEGVHSEIWYERNHPDPDYSSPELSVAAKANLKRTE